MPVTIRINGTSLSLVHKFSTGISIATIPDVCKTPSPGGPIPIPYPNIANSITLSGGTTTVKGDKAMAANKGSKFSLSNGDNPGVAGGIKSSTFMKEATWILYSFDVKMDGKNAARLTDKMFHNSENTVNLAGVMQMIAIELDITEEEARIICEAFCQAQKEHLDPKNSAVKGPGSPTRRFGELVSKRLKDAKLEQAHFIPRDPSAAAKLLDGPAFKVIGQGLKGAAGFEKIAGLVGAAAAIFPAGTSVPLWATIKLSRVLKGLSGAAWKGAVGIPDMIMKSGGIQKAFDCKFSAFSNGKLDTLSEHQKRYMPRVDGEGKIRVVGEDTCKCPAGVKQGWRASAK
jgi:Domain of unknown function (DUF4150)